MWGWTLKIIYRRKWNVTVFSVGCLEFFTDDRTLNRESEIYENSYKHWKIINMETTFLFHDRSEDAVFLRGCCWLSLDGKLESYWFLTFYMPRNSSLLRNKLWRRLFVFCHSLEVSVALPPPYDRQQHLLNIMWWWGEWRECFFTQQGDWLTMPRPPQITRAHNMQV